MKLGSSTTLPGTSDDWFKGYFKVVSDTAIDFFTPQSLRPGSYALSVSNPGFSSNRLSLRINANPTRRLATPALLTGGKTLDVLVARGNQPANVLSLLTISASGKSLVIPGLINLSHGGNAVTFIDPSFFVLPGVATHNASNGVARWALPAPMLKIKLYFQALMIDPANPNRIPFVVSSMDSTTLQ